MASTRAMHIVEIFLPLRRKGGTMVPEVVFDRLKTELTDRFGGVTAFARAPAEGLWKPDAQRIVHDEIVIFEVQVEVLDATWWRTFRARLERDFEQEQVLVRAVAAVVL